MTAPARQARGRQAHTQGMVAEHVAASALEDDGWIVRARRLRTEAGEIDLIAEKDGLLAIIEVKARPTLAGAAEALSPRQRARLMAAADIILAAHPDWGAHGVRFDLLIVDGNENVRRIVDAFRLE